MIEIRIIEQSHYNDSNTNADWAIRLVDTRTRQWQERRVGTGPIGGTAHQRAQAIAAELRASRQVAS